MIAAGLLLLFGVFSHVLGRPTSLQHDQLHVHERRTEVPSGFKYVGKAQPDTMLTLRIALTQSDPAGLEAALYDISTPGSTNYRQHLTKAQVDAFVAPKPESVQAVNAWLGKNNVTVDTALQSTGWLNVKMPVAQANTLLDADFNEYLHEDMNVSTVRTMSYSVPASVKGHLDFIHPATSFVDLRPIPAAVHVVPRPSPPATQNRGRDVKVVTITRTIKTSPTSSSKSSAETASPSPDASCKNEVTPECLQAIYNIPTTPASNKQNNLFVASFAGESADPADLQTFLKQFRTDIRKNTSFVVQSVDAGTNNLVAATAEASLDIQYTVGLATNVNTTFVTVGSNTSDGIGGFLDVINTLTAQEEVPLVLTTSFGFNEKDVPVGLANNLCNAYAQLGARGTTVLFGSGDGGVSGIQNTNCTAFQPTFPSGCPFVTSVGGTQGFGPETAVSFSSGGFSNTFSRPSYQDSAVAAYLKKLGKTNAGLFNISGRAYPDIAAQAHNFQIVRGGSTTTVSGTSAASPSVGAIIALINDAVLSEGGKPLGFLNPFLYQLGPGTLNDITAGNNPGCGTNGFSAAEGWDPITGLGTPDFAKLLKAAKNLKSSN